MSKLLTEENWNVLLRRIRDGRCTPFLGAGAGAGVLPMGAEIAGQWAKEYKYPLPDSSNLISVAQYLAVKYSDSIFPKELVVEMFKNSKSPDPGDSLEPHQMLAKLPLPIYLTTNYDDFMVQALVYRHREPKQVLCQWNKAVKDYVKDNPSIFEKQPGFVPTVANPVVFHLHGHVPLAESLVLTEDDYMDFLVNISTADLLPAQIARALTDASLLFIGYRISDWNFRVLLKTLGRYSEDSRKRLNIAVMPSSAQSSPQEVQDYLTRYYQNMDVRVYWGTAREFFAELKDRWEQSGYGN